MVDVLKSEPVKLAPEIVRAVAKDPELRSLRPGSEQYQAAFRKKFPEQDTQKTDSASVATTTDEKQTKEVSAGEGTTTTSDKENAEADAIGNRAKRKIAQLTATKKELERRVAELEAAGKTPKAAETQAKAEAKQEAPTNSDFTKPKPKIDDFKTVSEYQEALVDWKLEKKEFERDQQTRAKAAQEEWSKSTKSFSEKGKQLEKELNLSPGDFDVVVNDEDFKMWNSSRKTILDSEFGPQIAFEIASDDDMKEKFSKMSAAQQLTLIGKLEGKFEAKKQNAATTGTNAISAAKAPGKSLAKGTSGPTSGLSYKPGDFKAYEAMRKEQRPDKYRR